MALGDGSPVRDFVMEPVGERLMDRDTVREGLGGESVGVLERGEREREQVVVMEAEVKLRDPRVAVRDADGLRVQVCVHVSVGGREGVSVSEKLGV